MDGRPQFSIGETLSQTFSVYFRRFPALVGLAMVPALLSALLQDSMKRTMAEGFDPMSVLAFVAMQMVVAFLGMLLGGVFSTAIYNELTRGELQLGASIQRAFTRILVLLGASFLGSFLISLGFLLFIIPGFVFACMFCVVSVVAVVEDVGPAEALGRSAELTSGNRWKLVGFFLLLGILFLFLGGMLSILFAAISVGVGGGGVVAVTIGTALLSGMYSAFAGVLMSVLYFRLRAAKEGVGLTELSAIFA